MYHLRVFFFLCDKAKEKRTEENKVIARAAVRRAAFSTRSVADLLRALLLRCQRRRADAVRSQRM